jgi:uncharacterized protein YggT (Ycf19 family)
MGLLNFILNLFALVLWWNWLAIQFDPLARTSAASLVGTLRRAEPPGVKRWRLLAALLFLLVFRAFIYWEFGSSSRWTPALQFQIINIPFRSDFLGRMLLFSALSFLVTLGVFYLWLLLLSVANSTVPDTDPLQKLVRQQFKWIENWPTVLKLLLPFFVGALFWLALHPLLNYLGIVQRLNSPARLLEQMALIGATTYLWWKYLIVGVLALHLLNSYVYFGNHPFWNFINATARNFLHPFRWVPLRVGRVDFLPLIVIALVLLLTEVITNPPRNPAWFRSWYYRSLPF